MTRANNETPWHDFKNEIENTIMPNLDITNKLSSLFYIFILFFYITT